MPKDKMAVKACDQGTGAKLNTLTTIQIKPETSARKSATPANSLIKNVLLNPYCSSCSSALRLSFRISLFTDRPEYTLYILATRGFLSCLSIACDVGKIRPDMRHVNKLWTVNCCAELSADSIGVTTAKRLFPNRCFFATLAPPSPATQRCQDEHGYQRTTHDSRR